MVYIVQFLNGNEGLILDAIRELENHFADQLTLGLHERGCFDYGLLYLLEAQLGGIPDKELKAKRKTIAKLRVDGEENPWKVSGKTLVLKDNSCGIDNATLKTAIAAVAASSIAKIQLAQYSMLKNIKKPSFSDSSSDTPGLLY